MNTNDEVYKDAARSWIALLMAPFCMRLKEQIFRHEPQKFLSLVELRLLLAQLLNDDLSGKYAVLGGILGCFALARLRLRGRVPGS